MKIYRDSNKRAYHVDEGFTPTTDDEIHEWFPVVPNLSDEKDCDKLVKLIEEFLNAYAIDIKSLNKEDTRLYVRLGRLVMKEWVVEKYINQIGE